MHLIVAIKIESLMRSKQCFTNIYMHVYSQLSAFHVIGTNQNNFPWKFITHFRVWFVGGRQ